MRLYLLTYSLIIFIGSFSGITIAQSTDFESVRPAHFPDPPANSDRLFFLQRNLNANTVIYDLRRLSDGTVDEHDPLDVFYLKYALEGQRAELKWVERKFAYGYSFKFFSNTKEFEIELVAYGKRKIHLKKEGSTYIPLMEIAGNMARLTNLFVQADESGLWPRVLFIEIFGIDLQTGAVIKEKIYP